MRGRQVSLSRAGNLDLPAAIGCLAGKGTLAVKKGDLILFEQIQDAIIVLLDDRIFATNQLVELERDPFDLNAMVAQVMIDLLVMLRGLQHRLGGDATHVRAGATRCWTTLPVLPGINAGNGLAQLGGTNGSDVATWARTNHNNIKFIRHEDSNQSSSNRRCGSSSASFMATRPSTASRPSIMRWSYDMAR